MLSEDGLDESRELVEYLSKIPLDKKAVYWGTSSTLDQAKIEAENAVKCLPDFFIKDVDCGDTFKVIVQGRLAGGAVKIESTVKYGAEAKVKFVWAVDLEDLLD